MATALIPLTAKRLSNASPVAVSRGTVESWDVHLDEYGNIHKRPGASQFVDLGTSAPVDGIYYWVEKDILVAVSAGEAFSITKSGTVTSLGYGLERDARVSFTDATPSGTNTLLMANGQRIWKTTGGAMSVIADVDAPTNVTTITFLDQYVIANNANTPRFYFSNVNDPDTWSALDFVTAETKPDNVTGVFTTYEELLVVGQESIERYYNDGSTPFIQRRGAFADIGSLSPQSFQKINGSWFFLTDARKVVQMGGTDYKIISTDVDNELQSISYIEDARGDVFNHNGRSLYVLTFPMENKTFVYDYKLETWYRWGLWNSTTSLYDRWIGNCGAYASRWANYFVGSKTDGKIYYIDESYVSDAGAEIRSAVRTGYFDHGSMVKKRSKRIRMRARRGYGSTDSALMFRWRDDDGQSWNERQISFPIADYDVFSIQNQLGMYRARQYEIVMSDNAPLLAGQFEEEFDAMMR